MKRVHCRLLGSLELTIDGKQPPAELLWRKNAALLVYLVCSPDHRRTREHLVGLLWGDKTDSAARQSLREALRILRRVLGADAILTERDDVCLRVPDLLLDSQLFVQREADEPAGALEQVRGEFLEGFAVPNAPEFENWLAHRRMEWRQRIVSISTRLAKHQLRTGDVHGAGVVATNGLAIDLGSDGLVRLAMRSLALAGDRSAALDVYRRFALHMDEIGAAPETQTEELFSRIQDERTWSVTSRSGDPRGVRRAPLIGRHDEISESLRLWKNTAAEGVTTVITVDAESGLGKTRLAEEVLGHARLDGAVTLSVRGLAADQERPWIGLLSLVDDGLLEAAGVVSAHPSAVASFADRLPEWASRFPNHTGSAPWPLDEAMREVMRAVLDEQSVCLVLDDAHYLDSETLGTIELITRDITGAPLLVWLNTSPIHRRDEIERLRAKVGREIRGANLVLRGFSKPDIEVLVERVMAHLPADQRERLARRVAVDSGGIPLLAVELLFAVESGMELEQIPSDWPHQQHTLTETMPGDLPRSTVAAIRVGFRVLSEPAQGVLRVAAVVEEPATVRELAAGTGFEESSLEESLDELEWQRWLEADSRGYTFVARIVKQVLLEDMITAGQRDRILSRTQSARSNEAG